MDNARIAWAARRPDREPPGRCRAGTPTTPTPSPPSWPNGDPQRWLTAHGADRAADVEVVTFGCRLNAYESEAIRARAAEDGLADAVVFNTCAVTAEAVRQARQAIRKARRERPGRAADRHRLRGPDRPGRLRRHGRGGPGAGQRGKGARPAAYADSRRRRRRAVRVGDIISRARDRRVHAEVDGPAAGRARAYVEVQNGCDHRCTFCVIPYGRGNSRSIAGRRGGGAGARRWPPTATARWC